jgi:recombination protein RecA|tara:strand:+ start:1313 stop:2437 length:1125 start_codon:yes stop_codon:yes gene_type:complete
MKINESIRDELAATLADNLNKRFKKHQAAYFLSGESGAPTEVREFVSTGSSMLDLVISNGPNGGFPVGRITEITGLEASGKSLLAAHTLANTQKKGGVAVYIDTENAVSHEFLQAIGVDLEKMLYVPLDTIEDIFEAIEHIIESIRSSDRDRLVTIVVDSVAGSTTKVEAESDYDKDGWATSKAIIISKAMRKITNMIGRQKVTLIFTNQLRQKLGVMFGDPWTTSGGKALAFHSSVRLRLKQMGQIKMKIDGVDQVIGIKCRAQVVKNRVGPPLRLINYDMYFDSGIDDFGGWLGTLKDYKIVTTAGAWSQMKRKDGSVWKFQGKDFVPKLMEDKELKQEVYDIISEKIIMTYKKDAIIDQDSITVDDEVVGG